MFTLLGKQSGFCDGVPRRSFLTAGFLGAANLSLADVLRRQAHAAESAVTNRRAAVIFVELAGGPTQFETYDPKPDAPAEYRGEFGVVQTNIPGVVFSELMVEQARIADKLAVVRSIHHPNNSHDPSSHLSQTGYYKAGAKGGANEMPCFGAVVAKLRGANEAAMPAYVAVPQAMRNGRSAYLGPAYNPFETTGDPNLANFEIPNLSLSASMPINRLEDRQTLLSALDAGRSLRDLHGAAEAVDEFSQHAFELVHGSRAREAFDIAREPPLLRDRYGRNTVGQSMLLARRLVEAGVACVTVRCAGWDDHSQLSKGLKQRGPEYDRAIASLVNDLYDRGLQSDVLVVAMGEFGRTPRINGSAGRDHWGAVMSVLLAGGGLKPGVIGESNSKGEVPLRAPYRPENVVAMIYRHLGIDSLLTFNDSFGRPRYLLEERELIQEIV